MAEMCATCKFYQPATMGKHGQCHRYPPTRLHSWEPEDWLSVLPWVESGDWCGEYVARPDDARQPEVTPMPETGEICKVCREVGRDRRTLSLRYFYTLEEISELFEYDAETNYYSIRTCKVCRAVFMELLGQWIRSGGRLNINGLDDDGNRVITRAEWEARQKPL